MDALAAGRAVLAQVPSASILVALSGGKDSLATLDMCCRHFPRVEAFFMYRVEGLRCETEPIEAAARRHKVRVHYVPHWSLAGLLKYHVLRPHVAGAEKLKATLSQKDTERFLRELTGIEWFAYGERCSDSVVRNAKLKRLGGLDRERRRVYPVWRFSKRDVLGYLRGRKIPIPSMLGGGVYSGGVTLDAESLAWLQQYHPDDFRKLCEVFPAAPTLLYRRAKFGDPLDNVRNMRAWKARLEAHDGEGEGEGRTGEGAEGAREGAGRGA